MNETYMIYFDNSSDKDSLKKFEEAVRSSFVSKKNGNSSYLISAPEKMDSEEIYLKIENKIDEIVSFIVAPFKNYYGKMNNEVWDWLEDTFPDKSFEFKDENK